MAFYEATYTFDFFRAQNGGKALMIRQKKYPLQDLVAIAQFYPSPNRENKGIDLYTQSLKKRKFEEKNVNRH